MNIAMLCHACLGGSSRAATRLACALGSRGHAVSLVSASPPPAPADELVSIQLEPFVSPRADTWTTVIDACWQDWQLAALERHVLQLVSQKAVEVLHYHYAWPFARLVPVLRAQLGDRAPAIVATLHGTDLTHPPVGMPADGVKQTDILTTVSEAYAEIAATRLALSTPPAVIPNFVELADFPCSIDYAQPVSGRSKPRIVHVSNFRPVKDPNGVAAVFAMVRERIAAELVLVGDGPGLHAVEKQLEEAGLADDVAVLGYRPDVGQILADCDVLLMTSREESFCLAALEGMASGLAVVATRVGGLPELAEHGRSAMLFDPGDFEAGAACILKLVASPGLRLRLRAAARARAQRFSSDRVVTQYEELYASALAARRPEERLVSGAR